MFRRTFEYEPIPRESVAQLQMDDTDRRILRVLQRKGRISNAELAESVHLSASACHRRVQRLEADGYIRDYVALLNAPFKAGHAPFGQTRELFVDAEFVARGQPFPVRTRGIALRHE